MKIDLWSVDISPNSKRIRQKSSLNEIEIARAKRFKFPKLSDQWVFTRQALREILAQYSDVSAADIKFVIDEKGKPRLNFSNKNKNIFFNLSHSENKALIAITSICEIGVDVEKHKNIADIEEISKRFFSNSEYLALQSLPNSQKHDAFFRVWTRKEAVIKANGLGMSMLLDKFNVPIDKRNDWIDIEISNSCAKNGHYYIYDVMISDEYEAALCLYSCDLKLEDKPQLRFYNY